MAIRIGIMGYGNIGKGVETALADNGDMELAVVFTRRNPADMKINTPGVPVVSAEDAEKWKDKVDVLVLAGGSATDLPEQTPAYAAMFNVIDTFDTHAHIPQHFEKVDEAAKAHGKAAMISVGWDPGLFSLARLFGHVILPDGKDYTFWGRGVSQGHSDAIRCVPGVKDGKQYTCPVESALESVRNGENPDLTTREMHTREMHTRECYVVAEEGADKGAIENAIKTMPNYFADYDTTVHFISEEELKEKHGGLAHGGFVFRSGRTGAHKEHGHVMEYRLKLDSNPEFTTHVVLAYARALYRFAQEGKKGCFTVFDVPPAYLSPLSGKELRAQML